MYRQLSLTALWYWRKLKNRRFSGTSSASIFIDVSQRRTSEIMISSGRANQKSVFRVFRFCRSCCLPGDEHQTSRNTTTERNSESVSKAENTAGGWRQRLRFELISPLFHFFLIPEVSFYHINTFYSKIRSLFCIMNILEVWFKDQHHEHRRDK